jgi:hypothetical protein
MNERFKRITIGFGLMFGLQLIVAWAARAWFGTVGDSFNTFGIPLIFTLAVYFGGGLVMGLFAEKVERIEVAAASAAAIVLNVVLYLLGASSDLTFISIAFISQSPVLALLMNLGSVVLTAFVGSLIGARIQTPNNDWISRFVPFAGFFSLVAGPILLLTASGRSGDNAGLPWYVVAIILLSLTVFAGVGYVLSTRERNDSDEISINPDRRRLAR